MADDQTPVAAPVSQLDAKRPPCRCAPWEQRWKAERPEVCCNCGGAFAPHTVDARRVRPGEVLRAYGEVTEERLSELHAGGPYPETFEEIVRYVEEGCDIGWWGEAFLVDEVRRLRRG